MSKKIKSAASKTAKFFSGKGFYIALALCVAAIGVSCYYLFTTVNDFLPETVDREQNSQVSASVDLTIPESPFAEIEQDEAAANAEVEIPQTEAQDTDEEETVLPVEPQPEDNPPEKKDEETGAETVTEQEETEVSELQQLPISQIYVWPVTGGTVTTEYDPHQLSYNLTTHDWRTHDGLDIEAAAGTHVEAICSGVVLAVENDTLEGTCVTIDHGSGLISRYAGLQSVPTVSVGDQVLTGDIIGSVGSTNTIESLSPAHLHFEMTLNDMSVNPYDYLPEIM